MKNTLAILLIASLFSLSFASDCNCKKNTQNGSQDGEILDYVNNITEFMSEFVGETLDFEYYTGYIPVGTEEQEKSGQQSLFIAMTTKEGETLENMSEDTDVIYWFNGGPGCSSQYGNWNEIGPINLDGETKPHLNEHAWNKKALLIFIDQPLGAGLSYTDNPNIKITSTIEGGPFILNFFKNFYKSFPALLSHKTFLFGESYAGHYIPYYATQILKDEFLGKNMNLQGVGIGDGWTSPKHQIMSLSDFYFNAGIASQGQRDEILYTSQAAKNAIDNKEYAEATKLFDSITDDTSAYGNVDQYNFFYYKYPGQENPYTGDEFETVLNNDEFRKGFGIPSQIPKFSNCNETIYNNFNKDFTVSYQKYVEQLIEKDLKVLLFNGQLDIIVNGAGAQDWINTMDWTNLEKWQDSVRRVWYYPDQSDAVIGNYQKYENFCYANIYKAGHMVPSDQPVGSFDMLQRYLTWDW